MENGIEIIRMPGLSGYAEASGIQLARRDAVERGELREALFLVEHSPVITLGRRWHPENLLRTREEYAALGIDVCETDRGGDVTYHGPGQMVAYPVLKLDGARAARQKSVQWYLRGLEDVLIRQLAGYGIEAGRSDGYTGVWVGGAKIAAIGIRLHNWVSTHGVALNVNPDLSHFRLIIPCGIADKPIATLEDLLGSDTPEMGTVMADFARCFNDVFDLHAGDGSIAEARTP